jgi:uncharacterized protein (TIGR03083 family)
MVDEEASAPEPEQLPMAPADIRAADLAEVERIGSFVQTLTIEQWKKASAVAGWTIGDVVAHLNVVLGLYRVGLGAVHAGKGSGGMWQKLGEWSAKVPPSATSALHSINRAVPRLIDSALSPEVIKGQCAAGLRRASASLSQLESNDWTRTVYYRGGPLPLSFFLAAFLNELAMHGWDMASVLDPEAHLSEGARSILPMFYWSGTAFMLRPPEGTTGTVQVSLQDPSFDLWWRIERTDHKPHLGASEHADVTITGTSASFVLVQAGRLTAQAAFRNTSLETSGDRVLAQTFLESWHIL